MRSYITFYLLGRENMEEDGIDADIDLTSLAQAMYTSGDGKKLSELLWTAAAKAIAPSESSGEKRGWIAEHDSDIRDAGGDAERAWRAYQDGRTAELVMGLEPEVLDVMWDMFSEGDDDEDEAEDDEDDHDIEDDEDADDEAEDEADDGEAA